MVKVIHHRVTTQTVQGEITVNLNLTITLNQDGSLNVGVDQAKKTFDVPEIPDSKFIVPEFADSSEILPDLGEEV